MTSKPLVYAQAWSLEATCINLQRRPIATESKIAPSLGAEYDFFILSGNPAP